MSSAGPISSCLVLGDQSHAHHTGTVAASVTQPSKALWIKPTPHITVIFMSQSPWGDLTRALWPRSVLATPWWGHSPELCRHEPCCTKPCHICPVHLAETAVRKEFELLGKEAPEIFLLALTTEMTSDAQSGITDLFLPTTLSSFTHFWFYFLVHGWFCCTVTQNRRGVYVTAG